MTTKIRDFFTQSNLIKDFSYYLIGAVLPLIIGFIKTPIFTRHYSPEDYGYLGLVMIAFGYFTTLSYSWLSNSMWRFFNKYKSNEQLPLFYQNIFTLFLYSTGILLVLSLLVFLKNSAPFVRRLITLAFFHFTLKEGISLILITKKLQNKSIFYNVFTVVQSFLSFFIALILTFIFDSDISALLLCSIITDLLLFLLITILGYTKFTPISMTFRLTPSIVKELVKFGGLALIAKLLFMLIVSSDRFFIAYYLTMTDVGIYSKSYDLASLSLMSLILVFFSTINPSMNKNLAANSNDSRHMVQYLNVISLIGLPITFAVSLCSKPITMLFLGPDFQSGWLIMPFIFITMFVYASIKVYENKMNFTQQIVKMAWVYFFGLLLNIVLNVILIPVYGYVWAAISTLISYLLIAVLLLFLDRFEMVKQMRLKPIIAAFLFFIAIVFLHIYYVPASDNNIVLVVEASLISILYVLIFRKPIVSSLKHLEINSKLIERNLD